MSGPFTGSAAFLGVNTFAGISAAFARSNRLSALPVNLSLVGLDDGYDPGQALSNVQLLSVQHNLLGVLGAVGTPTVQNILPYLDAYAIPLYGPVTGVRSLRHPFVPHVVNIRASYDDECEAIVRLCIAQGRLRMSLFYQNDGFGQAGMQGLQLALGTRGLAILSNASYVRNTLEVQSGLEQLLAGIAPQAVLCVGVGPACGAFINAAVSNGSWSGEDIAYFALSFVAAESLAAALLPSIAAPVYVSQVVPPPYPSNQTTAAASLANEYNAELQLSCPNCTATFAGLEGYMAGRLVSSALQFHPELVAQWTAQPPSLVSVNASTAAARLAFANAVLEQGMLPAGGTVRQGPYGPACTGDEFDGLGFCSCNQGSHVVFLSQLDSATSAWLDLPQSVYTFVDCGTAILEPVLLANQPIIFGQSAALTGPHSAMGGEMARGLRAAFHEYNLANLGTRRNLLLISYDDEANVTLTELNVQDLIHRQAMFALVGTDSSAATLAQLPLTTAAGVPMVGPLSGFQWLRTNGSDYVVNVRASFDDQCAAVVATMIDTNHCAAIGILVGTTEEDDAVLAAMQLALAYHRTAQSLVLRYETTAAQGAVKLLAANSGVDCLYLNGAASDVAAAIVQLKRSSGSPTSFYVNDHVGPELLVEALGDDYSQVWMSQAMPSPQLDSSNSTAASSAGFLLSYHAAMATLFPSDAQQVSYPSVEGYLVGRLIAAAMTSDPEQTPETWLNNLYALGPISLDGLIVGPYQRSLVVADSAASSSSVAKSAAEVVCDQGYAAVSMASITPAGDFEQGTVYAVPSTVSASMGVKQVPLVSGFGSTGVCGVSSAYEDSLCPINSQKVYLSSSTTAYVCIRCAAGQAADGSTAPCEYPTDVIPSYSTALIAALGALVIALTLGVMAGVYALRKHAVLRAASPLFLVLILVGVLLALAAVLVLSQSAPSSSMCASATILGHLAYALSIGALVAKSYRLAAIFNQRQMKVLKINDRQLLLALGAALLLCAAYLTAWLLLDPPLLTLMVDLQTQSQTSICLSSSAVWSVVLVCAESSLLLYGMVIAYRCRHNPEAFNETRHIAVILYNCAVIGAVAVGVLYGVSLSFSSTLELECGCLLVISLTLLSVLFGPKFYQLYAGQGEQVQELSSQLSGHQRMTVNVKRNAADERARANTSHLSPSQREASHSRVVGSPLSPHRSRTDRSWMEAPSIAATTTSGGDVSTEQLHGGQREEAKVKQVDQLVPSHPSGSSSHNRRTLQLAQTMAPLSVVSDSRADAPL